jgi:surface polysaccharide O-acyltransferase-like enzyme
MLIGLYIITPFLRTYIASSSLKERYALIIIIFTFAALNSVLDYFVFNNMISNIQTVFSMFVPYVGYYISGYQIRVIDKQRSSSFILLFLALVCLLAVFLGTGFVVNTYGLLKGLFFYDYFSPTVICMSVCIFLLFSNIFSQNDSRGNMIKKFFEKSSHLTMGIYLIHPIVIYYVKIVFNISPETMNPVFGIMVFSLLTFIICYMVISVIDMVPLLRRIV